MEVEKTKGVQHSITEYTIRLLGSARSTSFQPFNLPQFYCNPLGGPSVYTSNVRYTYKTTLKLAKVSELEVGTF